MEKREHKVFIIVFTVVIYVLFLLILSGKIFSKQINELKSKNFLNSNTAEIDWEEIYPYDTTIEIYNISTNQTPSKISTVDKISNALKKIGNIGNSWSTLIYRYSDISKAGYVINTFLTDPTVGEEYIKLKNGYWISTSEPNDNEEEIKNIVNYYNLQKYLESEDIEFLYCIPPTKECKLDNQLPDGITTYENDNIDVYISEFDSLGLNYIDLRKTLHDDKLDHYSLFYKTDHHWNIEGGFWAASEIEKELIEKYGIDIANINQYGSFSKKTYKNAMFGSEGLGVTHFNAQSEDFDILFPDFENEFILDIPDKNINISGNFEEVFINYEGLNEVIEEGGGYAYEQILYGNRPYVKITNLNNTSGPRILILRDSFAIAVAPYLAFSCSELVLLDTRSSMGNFSGSIVNCINQFSPDAVIVLQSEPHNIVLNQ